MKELPQWLRKDENYTPVSDKDTFINKSILSLLNVLSKIKAQSSYGKNRFELNPALKLLFSLVFAVLIAVSRNFVFVVISLVYLTAVLSLMKAEKIIKILKISLTISLFTFIIIIPSIFLGSPKSAVTITSKVFATVTILSMLSHTTRWDSVTAALKRFFVPDVFIFVLDITLKYIYMLGNFVLNMLYSLKLKSVGKNKNKYTSLSGVAGTMFLKSKEMAEDMYAAMECRGFTGKYYTNKEFKIHFQDVIFICVNAALILIFVYFERH